MGNGKSKKFVVESPEIEITVRVGEEELAAIAFFSAGGEGWDVVVGIGDPEKRDALAHALDAAAEAVRKALFRQFPPTINERGDNSAPF